MDKQFGREKGAEKGRIQKEEETGVIPGREGGSGRGSGGTRKGVNRVIGNIFTGKSFRGRGGRSGVQERGGKRYQAKKKRGRSFSQKR